MKLFFVCTIFSSAASAFFIHPSFATKRAVVKELKKEKNVTETSSRKSSRLFSSSKIETFGRAIECAENFGYCDLEEMERLADELDSYNGNFFEHGQDRQILEKEVEDRKDVAEILRLQQELRLRMDYLEKANLFAMDMHQEIKEEGDAIW